MKWQFQINWQGIVEEAKQRRKEQRLTQAKLAMLAGISTPSISRFESGGTEILLSTVISILAVLGMSDRRKLLFTGTDAFYDPMKMAVKFNGKDGDKRIPRAISAEALDDHFRKDGSDFIKVFQAHRARIEHLARRKCLSANLDQDGSVFINTSDI